MIDEERTLLVLKETLERNPEDDALRRVYADALEEAGKLAESVIHRKFADTGLLIRCPPRIVQHIIGCEFGRYEDLGSPAVEDIINNLGANGLPGRCAVQILERRPISKPRYNVIVLRSEQEVSELLWALRSGTSYSNENAHGTTRELKKLEEELEQLAVTLRLQR
jgi:uncharacterized protein (TIGR02996 family)